MQIKAWATLRFLAIIGGSLLLVGLVTAPVLHDYQRAQNWRENASQIEVGFTITQVQAVMGRPLKQFPPGHFKGALLRWDNPRIWVYGRRFEDFELMFAREFPYFFPVARRSDLGVRSEDVVVEFDEKGRVTGVNMVGTHVYLTDE